MGKPFTVKVVAVGVGRTGIVAVTPFRASTLLGNMELIGVQGDKSGMSGALSDRFRDFRLVDD